MKRGLKTLLGSFIAFATSISLHAADVSGQWRAEFDTQIGLQKYLFTLAVDGGKLTGKAASDVGGEKRENEIKEGKVTGDEISFVEMFHIQDNDVRIEYKGKISGDEIRFTRNVADFAKEELVAKRVMAAAVAGGGSSAKGSSAVATSGLKLGMQSYTLRRLNFDQATEFAKKHGFKYLQLFPNHLGPQMPPEELKAKKEVLEKAGLIAYTFGVANTSTNKEENRKLFEFAKFMGMKLIIVEPREFKIFNNLEELVKEYDIKIAIHNHGITSMYGNPAVVRSLIADRDPRIGVCLDAGWIASARFNPAHVFQDYAGRVFDIHLKDKKVSGTESGDVAVDTFIGEGHAKLQQLFKAAREAGYGGVFAIETDNELADPTEHATKAAQFFAENTTEDALAKVKVDERRGFGGRGGGRRGGPPGGPARP